MSPAPARLLTMADLPSWREEQSRLGHKIVLTNGCFDLLHAGHVQYLAEARALGDRLLVAINSDASVRQLKGPDRPINSEQDRARLLAALRVVDAVLIFEEPRIVKIVDQLRPDLYAKGGDYTLETLDPSERSALEDCQVQIHLLGLLPGRSSSQIIASLQAPHLTEG